MYEDLIKTFAQKNIEIIPVKDSEEACNKILEKIPLKSKVGHGGSATLKDIGILDKIRIKDYIFYDRTKIEKYTPDFNELNLKAQHADYYLSGSNAVTKDGKIVNKDRTGNRVSSLIFGPKNVIIVVGKNKLVDNLEKALERIENIAAPMNAKRIGAKTPCTTTGKCSDCFSPERLCCYTVTIDRQFKPDRMTIILINEDLGY